MVQIWRRPFSCLSCSWHSVCFRGNVTGVDIIIWHFLDLGTNGNYLRELCIIAMRASSSPPLLFSLAWPSKKYLLRSLLIQLIWSDEEFREADIAAFHDFVLRRITTRQKCLKIVGNCILNRKENRKIILLSRCDYFVCKNIICLDSKIEYI